MCTLVSFESAQRIFKIADSPSVVGILLSGAISVLDSHGSEQQSHDMLGEWVGEISFLTHGLRKFTVIAKSCVQMAFLSHDQLQLITAQESQIGLKIVMDMTRSAISKLGRQLKGLRTAVPGSLVDPNVLVPAEALQSKSARPPVQKTLPRASRPRSSGSKLLRLSSMRSSVAGDDMQTLTAKITASKMSKLLPTVLHAQREVELAQESFLQHKYDQQSVSLAASSALKEVG